MCIYFILTYSYEFKVPLEKNPAPRSYNFRGPTFSNLNFLLICLTLLLTTHLLLSNKTGERGMKRTLYSLGIFLILMIGQLPKKEEI